MKRERNGGGGGGGGGGTSQVTTHLFRTRMILVLLNTCGRNLNRRNIVKKLDMFLLYFQQYILGCLDDIPYELSYDITEMFKNLKPKMVIFNSFNEVSALITAIRHEQPQGDILTYVIQRISR